MSGEALIHRSVDGWDLCSRGGTDWWVRDVELAERAGLAKPTDIRRTIKACIDEGLIRPAINVARGARDVDSAEFIATDILVPIASEKGGHRTATEYLLNRKAAVLVAMRLRTEKAAELVDAIVTVFLRVVDGSLAGEELRALREDRAAIGAELSLMKSEFVKLSSKVLDVENALLLGSGYISNQQVRIVASAKRRVAAKLVSAGWAASSSSAATWLQNQIRMTVGWFGSGQRTELLPVDLYTRVLALLEGEERRVDKYLKRRQAEMFAESRRPETH